jgi:hypothetical protein
MAPTGLSSRSVIVRRHALSTAPAAAELTVHTAAKALTAGR